MATKKQSAKKATKRTPRKKSARAGGGPLPQAETVLDFFFLSMTNRDLQEALAKREQDDVMRECGLEAEQMEVIRSLRKNIAFIADEQSRKKPNVHVMWPWPWPWPGDAGQFMPWPY